MRVLVTRPQPAAAATAARLEALGHDAIILPMMEAVHLPQVAKNALDPAHSAIAVTSAEAIRALSAVAGGVGAYAQTPIFCVGAATAQAAQEIGFQSVVVGPGTGGGLAHHIASMSGALADGLVYLAGAPRSPDFEAGLAQAAITVRVAEVYRMTPLSYAGQDYEALLQPRAPEAALFYSHETVRHFFGLVPPRILSAFTGMRLLCLSAHVASAVPGDFRKIAIAAEPREDALLALV